MLTTQQLADIEQNPYKADFPLLAQNPDLTFLDSAATAQRPEVVLDAERTFYTTMNANPLRGLYRLSVEATEAIDEARKTIARFIGAVDEKGNPRATRSSSPATPPSRSTSWRARWAQGRARPDDEVVISIMGTTPT